MSRRFPQMRIACRKKEGRDAEEGVPLVVPYAYVRFLGRMADVMMHMTLYLAVLRVSGAAFNPGFLPGSYEALLYLCLPMVLMETAFLGTLGTTPGKAMLGVSVRDYRGRRFSFPMAFRRSLFVMVLGLGCFAPSLMLLALFFPGGGCAVSVLLPGTGSWGLRMC